MRRVMVGWSRRDVRRVGLGVVLAVLLALPMAPAAAAELTWTMRFPSPASYQTGEIAGVSCLSTSSCLEVGSYVGTDGLWRALAEVWDGSGWEEHVGARPSGSDGTRFDAVSCVSATWCMAVGSYTAGPIDWSSAELPLAEVWNGATWRITPIPGFADDAGSQLRGVSCTSATMCLAVGSSAIPVSELWNGSAWTVLSTPAPTTASSAFLDGVSCPSATRCFAVGDWTGAGSAVLTLAEVWNGTRWSIAATPNPISTSANSLTSVSCSSPTVCMAVGSSGKLPLAELMTGTSWTVKPTPTVAHTDVALRGVGCRSGVCLAAGYDDGSHGEHPVVQTWNGSTWTLRATPAPSAGQGELAAASCVSPTWCTSAGGNIYTNQADTTPDFAATLSYMWDGASITTTHARDPYGALDSQLNAIACSSATSCVAVGRYVTARNAPRTLAERWNGHAWSRVLPPNPSAATNSELIGVSCSSATACVAVGYWVDPTSRQPLAETWNGSTWTIRATPSLSLGGELESVSCSSATACVAVGQTGGGRGGRALAETWNGASWTVRTSANVGYNVNLASVSCVAASNCMAVGSWLDYAGSLHTAFSEKWNGYAWTLHPVPAGVTQTQLDGVSCASAAACVAVGSGFGGGLAATWNGSTWTSTVLPQPATSVPSGFGLAGVACTSATSCIGVGATTFQGALLPVDTLAAEQLTGTTWTVASATVPADTVSSDLYGIACPATNTCIAVGDAGRLVEVPLAEHIT